MNLEQINHHIIFAMQQLKYNCEFHHMDLEGLENFALSIYQEICLKILFHIC